MKKIIKITFHFYDKTDLNVKVISSGSDLEEYVAKINFRSNVLDELDAKLLTKVSYVKLIFVQVVPPSLKLYWRV